MSDLLNKVYCESAVKTLARMPDGFLDLTVTSPPYDQQRTCYKHRFPFEKIAEGLHDKTKKGGVVVWNVASQVIRGSETLTPFYQAIYFVEQCGFLLHDTMIYQKRNFSHPESKRYHSVFEYMFVFSKGKPKAFNPIKDRKNLRAGEMGNKGVNSFTLRDGSKSVRAKKHITEFGMRHNVWLGSTRGQEECCVKLKHPAMMPKWMARDHILSWSNPGDVVYDPMGGSGTTIIEAEKLNRRWIMSEISKKYCADAKKDIAWMSRKN